MEVTIQKSSLAGEISIPASKSHTIRALILAALADGTSIIRKPLNSGDTSACVNTCRQFGAKIGKKKDKKVVEILEQMGCIIETDEEALTIEGRDLIGGEFDLNSIPDALPVLSVTACFDQGTTRLYNVAQARLKETDRICADYLS